MLQTSSCVRKFLQAVHFPNDGHSPALCPLFQSGLCSEQPALCLLFLMSLIWLLVPLSILEKLTHYSARREEKKNLMMKHSCESVNSMWWHFWPLLTHIPLLLSSFSIPSCLQLSSSQKELWRKLFCNNCEGLGGKGLGCCYAGGSALLFWQVCSLCLC